jgi:hypothetical protein
VSRGFYVLAFFLVADFARIRFSVCSVCVCRCLLCVDGCPPGIFTDVSCIFSKISDFLRAKLESMTFTKSVSTFACFFVALSVLENLIGVQGVPCTFYDMGEPGPPKKRETAIYR